MMNVFTEPLRFAKLPSPNRSNRSLTRLAPKRGWPRAVVERSSTQRPEPQRQPPKPLTPSMGDWDVFPDVGNFGNDDTTIADDNPELKYDDFDLGDCAALQDRDVHIFEHGGLSLVPHRTHRRA